MGELNQQFPFRSTSSTKPLSITVVLNSFILFCSNVFFAVVLNKIQSIVLPLLVGLGLADVAALSSVAGTALWPRSPRAEALPGEYSGPTHCVAVLCKPVLPHAKSAVPASKENDVKEH